MNLKRSDNAATVYSTINGHFGLFASFARPLVRDAARCNRQLHLHPSAPEHIFPEKRPWQMVRYTLSDVHVFTTFIV